MRPLTDSSLLALVCAILSLICVVSVAAGGLQSGLQYGFYSRACPNVEKIIYNSMYESFK